MISYNDYIIMKQKYIELIGGKIINDKIIEPQIIHDNKNINDFLEIDYKLPYKTTKYVYNIDKHDIILIRIELNDNNKEILVVIPGMSHNSFVGTSKVILNKLNELKEKFKEIFIFEYHSYKNDQIEACKLRDIIKSNIKKYKPELNMNMKIANIINTIIQKLRNIHLLGKCNGAWIALLILIKNTKCKGLYLSVPGIPFGIDKLTKIKESRLKKINFIFSWIKQDEYLFNWNKKSYEEKSRYDNQMKLLENKVKLKYISEMYDNNNQSDEKKYHEVSSNMITTIIKSI